MNNIHPPGLSHGTASPIPAARHALLAAFTKLALSRRYRDFGVEAIISTANVARSTFYYHFTGKDDLLLHNLRPLVAALAGMPFSPQPSQELEQWVAHIWEQRSIAGRLLAGATGRKIHAALVDGLNDILATSHPSPRYSLLAEQIAGSSLSLLNAWLGHRVTTTSADMAHTLWLGARSIASGSDDRL